MQITGLDYIVKKAKINIYRFHKIDMVKVQLLLYAIKVDIQNRSIVSHMGTISYL